ncbi:hypothetical protein GW17_00059042 [Ensete ventricosum]|nr:hypothetical protein GW17_00059042 [Ensete ventricosum]
MQRWLATARPPAGAAGHGLATYKGWSATTRPLARSDRPQGQQPARGGHPRARLAVASPQGPADNDHLCCQQGRRAGRRGGCPLAGQLPTVKGSRRLRRSNSEGGPMRVKEG